MRKSLKKAARPTYAIVGVDTSMSSIAAAAILYDGLLDRMKGPSLKTWRWNQGEHYYEKMAQAARGHDLIHDLIGQLGIIKNIEDIYIGIEEPVPLGMIGGKGKGKSGWAKQQIQLSGAFMGSLLRYGYQNIFEVNTKSWNAFVAQECGTKANREWDKWSVRVWAMQAFDVPDFPDLIKSKHGKIPRPEGSVAKAEQPDDIYDSLGIMCWLQNEIEPQLT